MKRVFGLLIAFIVLFFCLTIYSIFFVDTVNVTSVLKSAFAFIVSIYIFIKFKSIQKRSNGLYEQLYNISIENIFSHSPQDKKELLKNIDYYKSEKYDKAISGLEKLLIKAADNEDRYIVLTFLGMCCNNKRLTDESIYYFEEALKCKKSATMFSNLGVLYTEKGKYDKAIEMFTRAIQEDNSNPFDFNKLADLYLYKHDPENAIRNAEKALSLKPDMNQTMSTLAIAHAMIGNRETAEEYYEKCCAKNTLKGVGAPAIRKMLDSIYAGNLNEEELSEVLFI